MSIAAPTTTTTSHSTSTTAGGHRCAIMGCAACGVSHLSSMQLNMACVVFSFLPLLFCLWCQPPQSSRVAHSAIRNDSSGVNWHVAVTVTMAAQ
eukprot:scaffold305903_cov21-Tisochrysis_lutea.AAC.1